MTAREIIAGLRQAAHALRFMHMHGPAAACLAAIDYLEAVNP